VTILKFAEDLSQYLDKIEDGVEEAVIEFPIFREGKFDHPWHDKLIFDYNYLSTIIENHRNGAFHAKVSLDVSHKPENGAYGWVEDIQEGLFIRPAPVKTPFGQKYVSMLYARFVLNKLGIEAVKNKVYRYCSAEISTNYTNHELVLNGDGSESVRSWGPTLLGVALTNRPFINGLGEVSLSSDAVEHEDSNKFYLSCDSGPGLIFLELDKQDSSQSDEEESCVQTSEAVEKIVELDSLVSDSVIKNTSEEVGKVTEIIGESKMKFTELVKDLKSFSSANEQIEHLKANRHLLAEDDTEMFDSLLAAKEEVLNANLSLSEATHRKKMAEDAAADLRAKNTTLNLELSEAKEGSWAHRVEAFSAKLRTEDHYESVISKAKEILTSIKPENRDYKFSTTNQDESLDVISVLAQVLESVPKTSRVDFSEKSSANESVEVAPPGLSFSAPAATENIVAEGSDDEIVPDKVIKYSKIHGHFPPRGIWGSIQENGVVKLDLSKQ
jgi:hypothetical protein